METIIKVKPSELNNQLIDKIKQFIGDRNNINVTISLREENDDYMSELSKSIEQSHFEEDLVNFSMEDFMAYDPSK